GWRRWLVSPMRQRGCEFSPSLARRAHQPATPPQACGALCAPSGHAAPPRGGLMTWWQQWFAKKSLEVLHAEAAGDHRLRRVLGPVALTALGAGAVIGAGIFVVTGRVAREDAGPAIILSYCVAGLGCSLAALCYAEFAALAPVAGSAYTYAYATLGEGF